jgi:hypothetical protein
VWWRNCDQCDKRYEAQRPTSRFCSANCRVKNNGKPKPEDVAWPPKENFPLAPPPMPMFKPDENDPIEILRGRRRAKRAGDWRAYDRAIARWNALPPSVTDPHPENW